VTWTSTGSKRFTVEADNGVGSPVSKSHTIVITDPNASDDTFVYLPMVLR
jgi:hypothetical protein